MKPDNESGTSAAMVRHALPCIAIAAKLLEESLEETEVVVEIAGSFDSPGPLQEADKAHDLG